MSGVLFSRDGLIYNSSARDLKDGVSITNVYLLDVGPAMCMVLSGVHCKCEEQRGQFAALGEFSESQTHLIEIQRRV